MYIKDFEKQEIEMESSIKNEKVTYDEVMQLIRAISESLREFSESQREFSESQRELTESQREFSESRKETERSMKETDKQIKELGKQIGGLGNKFGTFNEGLVLPSLYKLFKNKFHCTEITERYKFFANGNSMEIDLLAISNDACYLIEIKSHYKSDAIEQLQKQIVRFRKIKKEYADRKIYGVIVATHYEKENIKELTGNGIYFISISDDLVSMKLPNNFKPKVW